MTTSDQQLNRETNLPHRLSLAEVLSGIDVSPGEATAVLTWLSQQFRGTAHNNLARLLNDHASLVSNPETYGVAPPRAVQSTVEPEYVAPTTPRYAQRYGGANIGAGVTAEQNRDKSAYVLDNDPSSPVMAPSPAQGLYPQPPTLSTSPAAQAQSTTPETLRSGLADASRNQGTQSTSTPLSPAAGDPGAQIGGVSLSDDERRQYQHPQGGALDRLAAQQRAERRAQLQKEMDELNERDAADNSGKISGSYPESTDASATTERAKHWDGSQWVYNDNGDAVSDDAPAE